MKRYNTLLILAAICCTAIDNHAQNALDVTLISSSPTCSNSQDGNIRLRLEQGTTPVYYVWRNTTDNSTGNGSITTQGGTAVLNNLNTGAYSITLTDPAGVGLIKNAVLTTPPPLVMKLSVKGDKCFGQNKGSIRIDSIKGGTPPYNFSLDNQGFSDRRQWVDLAPDIYFVQAIDSKGCRAENSAILPAGTQFVLNTIADTSMISGDTLSLRLQTSDTLEAVTWFPESSVIYQPASKTARFFPFFSTTYTVTAVDSIGCLASQSFFLKVNRNRSVYAPNAFAPNAADAENKIFTLYPGKGISEISYLNIYNREGQPVFQRRNFPAGSPVDGWDGTYESELLPPGVFVWEAELRFTDGRKELYWGDVTLIR